MATAKTILGIDLRVNSVKVIELEPGSQGGVIRNWGLTEIPYDLVDKHPQQEDAQAAALAKLIKTRKIKTREAVVVVGGGDVYVKLFTMAEVAQTELAEAIKWKFAEEIPFPIEEGLIDFYPLPRSVNAVGDKQEYLAACINQKLYHEIEYIIRSAGLKLVAVTILPDALQKVFEPEMIKERDKIITLMYMGKKTTNISIFKDVNLEFNRELNIGGENITLAMSGVLVAPEGRVEINQEEAEKIKIEHGIPVDAEKYPGLDKIPVTQLQAMVRPALEKVHDEIARTFEYYKGQTGEAGIDKIFLTGGSSLTLNLVDFLTEGLGIPVVHADVLEQRKIDESIEDKAILGQILPRLAGALGAALVGDTKINLLPEEQKHHWKMISGKFLKLQFLVPLYLVVLFLIYGVFWGVSFTLQTEINTMQSRMLELGPKLAKLDLIEKVTQREEERRRIYESYGAKRTKFPQLFQTLSKLTPRGVVLDVLNLTPTDIHLWGTAFEDNDTAENILSQFVIMLANSERFDQVKLLQAIKNYDYVQDAFNFEITAQIKM